MADNDDQKRDEILKRLLKTPPKPKKSPKRKEGKAEASFPDNDHVEGRLDQAKQNIQSDE